MIVDKLLEFADALAIAATADAVNPAPGSIDLGVAGRDLSPSKDLYVVIQIDENVVAAGGAANVTFNIVDDDNEALESPTVLLSSGAIAKGTLVAGYRLAFKLPKTTQRYLGVTWVADTNDTTGGKFSAYLTHEPPTNVNYASGFSVA
jgi:hypothetical protein